MIEVWLGRQTCSRCSRATDRFLVDPVRCLACAGLDKLVYLPSGDPALTRRSKPVAVVLVFRKNRKERQGSLVTPENLAAARASCENDAERRKARRVADRVRRAAAEGEYVRRFAAAVVERFPGCPAEEASDIARRACQKSSGRVGRTAAAKELQPAAVELAVRAHIRHVHTSYDALLERGVELTEARRAVREKIETIVAQWRRIQ